jgi:WD40 repeat protein
MRPGVRLIFAAAAAAAFGLACSAAEAQSARKYGALAIDRSNGFYFGFAVDYDDPAAAEKRAVEEGNKRGGDTAVVLLWSGAGCGAYRSMNPADGKGDAYGWAVAGTRSEAEAAALREGQKRAGANLLPIQAWACNSKTAAPYEILKDEPLEPGGRDMVLQHGAYLRDIAFSPDGALLATVGSGEDKVRLYDPKTGKLVRTIDAPGVNYIAVSPGGKLATVAWEQIIVWDLRTGAKLGQHDDEDEVYSHPAYLSEDVLVVEGTHNTYDPGGGQVTSFFNGATAKLVRKLVKNEPDMHSHGAMVVAPGGRRLAVDGDGAEIWDAETGKLIQKLGTKDSVADVGYSPDGRFLAVTGDAVEIYDAQSHQRLKSFGAVPGYTYEPTFSANGARLVTGYSTGVVRVWDVATGREIHKLEGHSDSAYEIALSPDGKLIASGGKDATVRLWNAETGKPLKIAPPVAPRPATPTRPATARSSSPASSDAATQAAQRKLQAAAAEEAARKKALEAEQAAADKLNQQILARDNEIKAANEKAAAEAAARQAAFQAAMTQYQQAKARNDAEVAAAEAAQRKYEADAAAAAAAKAKYEADLRAYQQALEALPKP